ncbi:MAG: two-component system sensor histidine kinase NtrB, partial [Desulfonatronovibrionaceae bacterium]
RFAAIGEAASHLSHEIKNPLMLMSGFARQISKSLPQDDPNQNKLEIISQEALRLEKMLNQVKDFTRPQMPSKEKGQINDIIRETFELVSQELDMSKIHCTLQLNPDLPEARFDKSQMKQVLINLFKNAWEAMPEGGTITIFTDYNKERIRVTVQDSGTGIPPDKIKIIFSPFYTTKDKGTGLGLAVTYRIIQDHKGEVTISSQPGQGSSFTFYLPRS